MSSKPKVTIEGKAEPSPKLKAHYMRKATGKKVAKSHVSEHAVSAKAVRVMEGFNLITSLKDRNEIQETDNYDSTLNKPSPKPSRVKFDVADNSKAYLFDSSTQAQVTVSRASKLKITCINSRWVVYGAAPTVGIKLFKLPKLLGDIQAKNDSVHLHCYNATAEDRTSQPESPISELSKLTPKE